jgi:hypothetical protein
VAKRFGNVYSVKTFSSLTADMLMFEQRCDSDNFIPCDLPHGNSAFAHGYKISDTCASPSNYFAYIVSLLRPCLLLVARIRLHKGRNRIHMWVRREIYAPEDADVKLYFEEASIWGVAK